jgi:hypothetical protein
MNVDRHDVFDVGQFHFGHCGSPVSSTTRSGVMIVFDKLIILYNEIGKRPDQDEFAQSRCDHDSMRLHGPAARSARVLPIVPPKKTEGSARPCKRARATLK